MCLCVLVAFVRFPSDPYLGDVSWTDAALAPTFDRLSGQSRPTLVVVTADHGDSLGEHGERSHSLFAYEPALRVPLIVAEIAPGQAESKAKPGAIDTPVRYVDLRPTILAAAAAPAATGSATRTRSSISGSQESSRR